MLLLAASLQFIDELHAHATYGDTYASVMLKFIFFTYASGYTCLNFQMHAVLFYS